MSSISQTHNVEILTDNSKALDGQRLSRITFKTPTDKKDDASYKRPVARCVSVPVVTLMIQPDCIAAALQAAYEELQDAVIRDIIVNDLQYGPAGSDGKLRAISIHDDQISYEAIAAYSARVSVSGKLSKEVLNNWFDSDLKDQLTLALAAVLQLPDEPSAPEQQRLNAAVDQHRNMISALASPKSSLPENICKQLKKAVSLAEDSKVKSSIINKLETFMKPAEIVLAIGLGE